jgi:hypothetical protein
MVKKETIILSALVILFLAIGFYLGWLDNGPRLPF